MLSDMVLFAFIVGSLTGLTVSLLIHLEYLEAIGVMITCGSILGIFINSIDK